MIYTISKIFNNINKFYKYDIELKIQNRQKQKTSFPE